MNLVDACIDKKVKRIVALSTDKEYISSVNLYGATKLTSDRLFVAGNSYSGDHNTNFSVVNRYGKCHGISWLGHTILCVDCKRRKFAY